MAALCSLVCGVKGRGGFIAALVYGINRGQSRVKAAVVGDLDLEDLLGDRALWRPEIQFLANVVGVIGPERPILVQLVHNLSRQGVKEDWEEV